MRFSQIFYAFMISITLAGPAVQAGGKFISYEESFDFEAGQWTQKEKFTYNLHKAVLARDLNHVNYVITTLSSGEINSKDSDGDTALLTALSLYIVVKPERKESSVERKIIDALLVNANISLGNTAQEEFQYIRYAAASEDYALVRELTAKSKNYKSLSYISGNEILSEKIKELYSKKTVSVNPQALQPKKSVFQRWLTTRNILIGSVIAIGIGIAAWQRSSLVAPVVATDKIVETTTKVLSEEQRNIAPVVATVAAQAISWSSRLLKHCYNTGNLFTW